jgi:hypothetical protein
MSEEGLALLRDLLAEVRALRADIAISKPRRAPSHADAVAFAKLLPEISSALPNVTFSVRLLHDYAALNAPQYFALRDALASAGGSRKLGRLLRRGAESDIAGFEIAAVAPSREGMLWNCTTKTRKTHIGP